MGAAKLKHTHMRPTLPLVTYSGDVVAPITQFGTCRHWGCVHARAQIATGSNEEGCQQAVCTHVSGEAGLLPCGVAMGLVATSIILLEPGDSVPDASFAAPNPPPSADRSWITAYLVNGFSQRRRARGTGHIISAVVEPRGEVAGALSLIATLVCRAGIL